MDNSRNSKRRAIEKNNSNESKHTKTVSPNASTSSMKPKGSSKPQARLSSDKKTRSSTSGASNQEHKNSLEMEVDTDENLPRNFQELKSHPKLPDVDGNDSEDGNSNEDKNDDDDDISESSESSESSEDDDDSSDEDDDNEDNDNYFYKGKNYVSDDYSETSEEDDDDEDDDGVDDNNGDDNKIDFKSSLMSKPHFTAKEHLLGSIAIALKHHMSYKAVVGLLEVLKIICNINLPATRNAFWKAISLGDSNIIEHYYCKECREYLGKRISGKLEKQCPCAKNSIALLEYNSRHFFEISLSAQLKQLFSISNIYESLQYRFNRIKKQNDALEDIYDGAEYRRLCLDGNVLSDRNNFSFTFSTGACKMFNSENTNAWPIYVQINELPPHLRNKYMLLAGIYIDNQPPQINDFLLPLVTEIKKLYADGIVWKPSEGVEITSKFIAVICSVDSVTRANILQMNQYDEGYGCINCYAEGQKFSRGKHVYPMSQNYGRLRTHSEAVNDMLQAYNTKTTINGFKKISPLTALPLFDICKDVVIESVDAIFLGAAKQHIKIMMKTSNAPFYIGSDKHRSLIDKTLLNIKLPSCCTRNPRGMSKWNLWKACEWKNWLGHAPACLEGVIDVKYTKHLSFLCEAIDILNGDFITQQRLNRAENLLKKYVKLFEQYFGVPNMTYNIHQLTHITDTVRNWGPMWSYSRFRFESWNNKIMNVVKRPHKRINEITTHFLMYKHFTRAICDSSVAIETKNFVKDIMKISSIENEHQQNIITGKSVERAPTNDEKLLLLKENYQPQIISCYNEIKINGVEYQSQSANETQFCNSIIATEMKNYGTIVNIISFQHENQKVFKIFMKQFRHIKYAFNTQYISQVKQTDHIVCVNTLENITPAIKISTANNIYIYKLSNCWENDGKQ